MLRYGPDIINTVIVNVIITDGQLTTILAPLLEYARGHGLVYELRPSQLIAHLGRIATLLMAESAVRCGRSHRYRQWPARSDGHLAAFPTVVLNKLGDRGGHGYRGAFGFARSSLCRAMNRHEGVRL